MNSKNVFAFRVFGKIVGLQVAKDLSTLRIHHFTISLWLDTKRWQWFGIEKTLFASFLHVGILSFGKFNSLSEYLYG